MSGEPKVRTVQTVVIAVVPEYRLVLVGDADGRHYALTRRTQCIDLAALSVGQRVVCTVAARLAIVLSATTFVQAHSENNAA